MDELKKTIEALGKAFEKFKAENDKRLAELEGGRADPLLAEKVDKINEDISQIAAMKTQLEELEKTVSRDGLGGDTGWGQTTAQKEHAKAFERWFRKGIDDGLADLEVQANLSTLSDPDGGFTVPEEVEKTIDRVAGTVSIMRQLATVMTIGTDTYKKLVSKGGATSGWVAEKGTRSETTAPTLAEIALNTKEIYAMPAATQKLLDDSRVDIAQWLANEVSIEFAEEEGAAFILGNGVEKPHGILDYTTVANASYTWGKIGYIAGGAASTFTDADKLIDLQHALKSIYRNGATFLMNDATQQAIRKFKDGDGRYIWLPGLQAGVPDTLLGKPVAIDDNMSDIDTNAYPIAFGNFKRAYLIIDRFGIRVLRDPYTSKPYVLFYTTRRVGGGIVMYEAIKLLKVAAS